MTVTQSAYAALQWLRQQVRKRTPKPWWILVPRPLPYVPLVSQRIEACLEQPLSVSIPWGMPFAGSPALARLQKLNAALAADLAAEAVAALVPYLRRGLSDGGTDPRSWLPRMSPDRALALLQATGACSAYTGPRRWHDRLASLMKRAAEEIAAAKRSRDASTQRSATIRQQEAERVAGELRALLPALRELDLLAERFERGGSRRELLEHYWAFARRWLVLPLARSAVESVERLSFASAAGSEASGQQAADDFFPWLDGTLQTLVLQLAPTAEPDVIIALAGSAVQAGSVFLVPPGSDEAHFASEFTTDSPCEPIPVFRLGSGLVEPKAWSVGQMSTACSSGTAAADCAENQMPSLGAEWVGWGLRPERPLSATALPLLLTCPFRFFLERLAHVHPSRPVVSTERLEASAFGALVHDVFSAFLVRYGREFFARDENLGYWMERIDAVGRERFEALLEMYPLWGESRRTRELARLQAALQFLIAREWEEPPREFWGAECRFGEPHGVSLLVSGAPLYVRGSIDWLARTPRGLAVRELKTVGTTVAEPGRLHVRRYLQLGLYVLAIEAGALGAVTRVADAAVVLLSPSGVQRWHAEQKSLEQLRMHTVQAMEVAAGLLRAGKFPRTPSPDDCVSCPFFHYCGEEAASNAVRGCSGLPDEELRRFYAWRESSRRGLLGGDEAGPYR